MEAEFAQIERSSFVVCSPWLKIGSQKVFPLLLVQQKLYKMLQMFQDEGSKVMKDLNCVLYKPILKWIFVEGFHGGNSQFHRNNRVSDPTDRAFKIRFFHQQIEKRTTSRMKNSLKLSEVRMSTTNLVVFKLGV